MMKRFWRLIITAMMLAFMIPIRGIVSFSAESDSLSIKDVGEIMEIVSTGNNAEVQRK